MGFVSGFFAQAMIAAISGTLLFGCSGGGGSVSSKPAAKANPVAITSSSSSSLSSSSRSSTSSNSTVSSSSVSSSSVSSSLVSSSSTPSSTASSSVADNDNGQLPSQYAHFGFSPITEARKTELNDAVLNSSIQPSVAHPRLFGSDTHWYGEIKKLDQAPCTWSGQNQWGYVKNTRSLWGRYTMGYDCSQSPITSLSSHPDAKYYMSTQSSTSWWNKDLRERVLLLIRKMYACYKTSDTCQFSKSQIDTLAQNFVQYEVTKQKAEVKNAKGFYPSWHSGYSGEFFDLGSLPQFKFWCLLIDALWDNTAVLSQADKDYISGELENEINNYITIYNLPESSSATLGRWAIWNGNNWTSVLNAAALYWVITFWHEQNTKAREVLDAILKTGWLHRDFFLADGAYIEGPSYFDVTFNGLLDQMELLKASFGQPLHSIPWQHVSQKTTKWLLENVSPDSLFIDFGDAWANTGFSSFYFLFALAWDEFVGIKSYGTSNLDACEVKRFFSKSYFAHHFYDTWKVTPLLSRDWFTLAGLCNDSQQKEIVTKVYPEYKMSTMRTVLPGTTQTAATAGTNMKYLQADQTFLALNGVSNSLPHREVDFAAIIWSAFGSRLLYDWGYGELSSSYNFYSVSGQKGRFVKESDNDTLEFYIKQIDKPINTSLLKVGLYVHYINKEVLLSNYLSSVSTSWAKVSIPLKDFGVEASRWTAIRGDAGEPWATPGVENFYLRTNGAVTNGHIGLDEIKFVNANDANKNTLWYGDAHPESIADGARSESPSYFYFVSEETTSGANNTSKWMKVFANNSGRIYKLFYSNDIDELVLANTMDYLPVGANTLVLPNALESAGKISTNMSQFKGQDGTVTEQTIDGYSVSLADASAVYGSTLANGNLDYFYRYTVALENGNFLVLDAFKAKAGKEDKIQEFWYTKFDSVTTCTAGNASTDVVTSTPANNILQLAPRCNRLKNSGAAESMGRMISASLQPGRFYTGVPDFLKNNPYFERFLMNNGDVIKLKNRINSWEYRRLSRYESDQNVSEDVRVFLLQGATTASGFASASVTKVNCATNHVCFNVVDGSVNLNLQFEKQNGAYRLKALK